MFTSFTLRALSVGATIAAFGCSSSVTSSGDAGPATDRPAIDAPAVDVPPTVRVPLRHRATAMTCNAPRPPSSCTAGSGPPVTCTDDRECTAGTNGRCVGNGRDGCNCNYDACAVDGDCPSGGVCECRLSSRGASGANVCIPGDCRVDADCGPRGFCSPTLGDCGTFGGLSGYYCHTAADECIDDADCGGLDAGFLGQPPYCAYSRTVGRWRCSNQGCAG